LPSKCEILLQVAFDCSYGLGEERAPVAFTLWITWHI
jgi:hypothetical protein